MSEIARYDDTITAYIVGRKRDKSCRLVRDNGEEQLPPWVEVDEHGQRVVGKPTSFGQMFKAAKRAQGMKDWEATRAWHVYSDNDPRAKQ